MSVFFHDKKKTETQSVSCFCLTVLRLVLNSAELLTGYQTLDIIDLFQYVLATYWVMNSLHL